MKKFRNACYIVGFFVFCLGACCAESEGWMPFIIVSIGIAIMGLGIIVDVCIKEGDDGYEDYL